MIKIEDTETYGWEAAIHGMRNPLNSWSKSDSAVAVEIEEAETGHLYDIPKIDLGKNDYDLMRRLVKSGTDHAKFMRMIMVSMDVTAPLYWWKEFDTYKVGTVANSTSTMHTLHKRDLICGDFSYDHLTDAHGTQLLLNTIDFINEHRKVYCIETDPAIKKNHWYNMIQMLPTSYNQKRTVVLNYQVLQNMYRSRKNHKLDEWHTFCDWIEKLPYSELITGREN